MKKMKLLFIVAFLIASLPGQAQVHGNKNIVTKKFTLESFEKLIVNLNIDLDIITSGDQAYAEITTDENIIPFINLQADQGVLDLTQNKWIEASGKTKITLVQPNLKEIINDSWANIHVKNLDKENFILKSVIGKVKLSGKVKKPVIYCDNSRIDITDLVYEELDARVTEEGKISSNDKGEVIKNKKGTSTLFTKEEEEAYRKRPEFVNAEFINVNLKNNKWSGFSAYVKGPKKDGRYFAYGLNFRMQETKKERWSVGTKLYKLNKKGIKKLVYTVQADDKDSTVELWE